MKKLYKHFKGNSLIEKNIYEVVSLNNKGSNLDENIIYTGEGIKEEATNLVIYRNSIYKKLFCSTR